MDAKPLTENDIRYDPRTQLEIVNVSEDYIKHFQEIQGTLIHWFGTVDKVNRHWKQQRRVCIISDCCIYMCMMNGGITRCVPIQTIQEIILSPSSTLGIKVLAPDYDMMFAVLSTKERETVLNILQKLYWALTGQEIRVRSMRTEAGEKMEDILNLKKPKEWTLKIEPLKTKKSLVKLLEEKQQREARDKAIVHEEFDRIKRGLRQELETYRNEEYDRVVAQVQQYVRLLTEKDEHIERLKAQIRSLEKAPTSCRNCDALRRALESTPLEDKKKIRALETEVTQQNHVIEHFKIAEMHRKIGTKADYDDVTAETQIVALRQELDVTYKKLRDLQRLVVQSPYPTEDMRLQAETNVPTASFINPGTVRSAPINDDVKLENDKLRVVLAEKEKELQHLHGIMRESYRRQLEELSSIRQQFQQYDDQIVNYLEKVFSGQVQMGNAHGPATALQLAQATARAARSAATPPAFTTSPQQMKPLGYRDTPMTSTPIRTFSGDQYLDRPNPTFFPHPAMTQ
eukprot:PhF_6_TR36204/c0_g1_i1/m.52811